MLRIGIVGYGNLAKGAECAIRQNPDMELVAVFSRRDPASVRIKTPNVPVLSLDEAKAYLKTRSDMEACLVYDQEGEFKVWCSPGFILEE